MTKVNYMSKLSKARRERIRRRETRLTDATTTTKLNLDANMISLCTSVSLKSLASLDNICSSASFRSSRYLSSLVASLSWKLLAPSASECGGRDQPIEVNDLGSVPGSPVKQRPFRTVHGNSDNDALSTLNEIRVLHSKLIKRLTNRTNTIIKRQAKRRAIRRKTLTPSASAESINYSGKVNYEGAFSTPASKVGNQSGTTDSDTTLVPTESPRASEDLVLNTQGSTVLQETLDTKLNISTSPTTLPKPPVTPGQAPISEHAPTSIQRVNGMIDAKTCPKEIIISKPVRAVPETAMRKDTFVDEITVHRALTLSPKSAQLPQCSEERMKRVPLVPFPQSVLSVNSPIDRPSHLYHDFPSSPSGVLNIKENIPPPPVTHARINARGSPRAKKPVRYRDKLPKSLLCDDNGSTRKISKLEADMTIVRNVDNYLCDAKMPTQSGIVNYSTTNKDSITRHSDDRECPRVMNENDPHIPGGWTGHFESSKQTSDAQGTFPQRKVDVSSLERQNPDQSEDAAQTSLSSTLESVSYLMDLVVFPLKLVWRMTYGG